MQQGGINCGVGAPRKFQFFLVVSAHKQHFRDKKYSILTFHYKTASVIEFIVTNANIL